MSKIQETKDMFTEFQKEWPGALEEWRLVIGQAKTVAGSTKYSKKIITLSRHYINSETTNVRDTLLHEIAHVIAGYEAGHGPLWQEIALAIGCNGKRCLATPFAKPKWLLKCSCREYPRYRRPTKKILQARCARCRSVFTLQEN